jgi:hypothetical protein
MQRDMGMSNQVINKNWIRLKKPEYFANNIPMTLFMKIQKQFFRVRKETVTLVNRVWCWRILRNRYPPMEKKI